MIISTHYCDRCGKEIEKVKYKLHIPYGKYNPNIRIHYDTLQGFEYTEYELCRECSEELKKWLNGV